MTLSEFYKLDATLVRDEREAYAIGWGERADEYEHIALVWAAYSDIHVYRNKETGAYVYTETSIGD